MLRAPLFLSFVLALIGLGGCEDAPAPSQSGGATLGGVSLSVPYYEPYGAGASSAQEGGIEDGLGQTERCGNGVDDNQNGLVDEGCGCELGAVQPCYVGAPQYAGVGACAMGSQRCIAVEGGLSAEEQLTEWSACEGSVAPSEESCDGIDANCDGVVDPACVCEEGATRPCYGDCGSGEERCEGGAWTGCESAGLMGQYPAGAAHTPWEMNDGEGLVSFSSCADQHGAISSYDYAVVPAMSDPAWSPAPDQDVIGYSKPSTLCDMIQCRCGGDFTYFRTFVDVEAGATLGTFTIEMSGMDDGVRCTIYNSAHPNGVTVEGAYVFLGGSTTANLAPYILSGERNTILLTHLDDCCSESNLNRAAIVIDGQTVTRCQD